MRAGSPAHAPAGRLPAAGVGLAPPRRRAAVARSAQSRYSWRMDSRALPHCVLADLGWRWWHAAAVDPAHPSAKETRSEEHTSELQSLMRHSYAVFCLKKKNATLERTNIQSHKKNHKQQQDDFHIK